MKKPLTLANAETATFECTFGRGCEGLCCKNGEPSATEVERLRIEAVLPRAMELMRPVARDAIEQLGWLTDEIKLGHPMVRVADEWCVFFNEGCVLHKLGAQEGDFSKYKPIQCSLFPLEPNGDGSWYVRQWDVDGEEWDLFCLNPENSAKRAAESLAPELAVAAQLPADFAWETA